MKKSFLLLAAMCCLIMNSWAGNTITYTADQKLPETTDDWDSGLHTNAFNVTISSHKFSNGTGTITFNGDVSEMGDYAFSFCDELTSITIPNSVTTIGERTFEACHSLTSITIPNSVITIGDYAFKDCDELTSVTIPNSVTTIGKCAFSDCSGLTSFIVDAANMHYCSVDGVLFNYAKNTLIQYPIGNARKGYLIPNSVTTIGSSAFEYCKGLTSVTIPNSVTTIEDYAFSGCSSLPVENNLRYADTYLIEVVDKTLSTYSIKKGTKWIGQRAFYGCSSLESVTLPASITTIASYTFYGCSSLITITIPASVTSIGWYAFQGCSGLTSITCLAVNPPACDYACFSKVKSSIPIYVPKASISDYKTADEWKDFTNYMATTEKYGLYIKGEQVTSDNCDDILGDGTVSYDPGSKTLTLDNANISCSTRSPISNVIYGLTMNCKGNNTLTYTGSAEGEHGLYANSTMTITTTQANSSLTVNSPNAAVYTGLCTTTVDGNNFQLHLILNGAQYGFLNMGSQEFSSNLEIKDANVDIAATSKNAIFHANSLTVDGAILTAKGNGNYATISCDDLIRRNGVAIRSAHTYDTAQKKFFDAAGNEAKDDIIIGVEGTGLEELTVDNARCTNKFIHNGHLLIMREGKMYNAFGGRVK